MTRRLCQAHLVPSRKARNARCHSIHWLEEAFRAFKTRRRIIFVRAKQSGRASMACRIGCIRLKLSWQTFLARQSAFRWLDIPDRTSFALGCIVVVITVHSRTALNTVLAISTAGASVATGRTILRGMPTHRASIARSKGCRLAEIPFGTVEACSRIFFGLVLPRKAR